jgi:hypothetical protein
MVGSTLRAFSRAVLAAAAVAMVSACGAGDSAPAPDPNTSKCFRCTVANGALTQQEYACTPADAQQFGRPCFR